MFKYLRKLLSSNTEIELITELVKADEKYKARHTREGSQSETPSPTKVKLLTKILSKKTGLSEESIFESLS